MTVTGHENNIAQPKTDSVLVLHLTAHCLTHSAPDQPLPFRYEIPCKGKWLCQTIPVYNFKNQ